MRPTVEALLPGTRVRCTITRVPTFGTVVRDTKRAGAYRKILVRWDATSRAGERESIVSSLHLRELS